jgi:hypothetical protein
MNYRCCSNSNHGQSLLRIHWQLGGLLWSRLIWVWMTVEAMTLQYAILLFFSWQKLITNWCYYFYDLCEWQKRCSRIYDTVETISFGQFITWVKRCFVSWSISPSRSVCNWLSNYISKFQNFYVQWMGHQRIPQVFFFQFPLVVIVTTQI